MSNLLDAVNVSANINDISINEDTLLETDAGVVDVSFLAHGTGAQMLGILPTKFKYLYPYLIWAGDYTADTLPTKCNILQASLWSSANQTKGLLGRLVGCNFVPMRGHSICYIQPDGKNRSLSAILGDNDPIKDSVFTLAQLVRFV